uniref:Uncharacterized protein n=1 Tax=Anguilla anguilla TaxID=7936 RepID=A0A0E9PQ52_ANGAN
MALAFERNVLACHLRFGRICPFNATAR